MAAAIPRAVAADGTELHLVPLSPPRLPRVQKRDLEQAWEAAHSAARAGAEGPRRGFRFAGGPDVVLRDRDARVWASSVDRIADLSTAHGISVCLRLLGLVALLAQGGWAARFVRLDQGSAELDGALLGAAARTVLTDTGALDENALRAQLLPCQSEEQPPCRARS
ncbi:MAG TPA: hypothetical protein PLV07_05790 [Acidiphilium sp.]|jgi:hypothetical protein|uniref:hypothetical protein n=1 Tax=unclassified Acidiphilium TaxID=2617493 RepID=UPI000BDC816E|nr:MULTISPECIES: hypothetical protein [unclassified Acidiphilium]OYV57200.1 MAG: hypothetical protein B7Z76_02680 [Acidiphilium sp. 20-67-58]HQT60608.1 hypothetical protein [Acidiphilium sp.]HQU11074.1 hypothetical protein [Acidiphilium sp.]